MKVRAKTKCFVDNGIREEGEVFEFNGELGKVLEPVDTEDSSPKPTRRRTREEPRAEVA